MMKINVLLLFITFASNQVGRANNTLNLAVYYESLCPDSKSFVVNELKPAVDFLQEYVKVKLVPFGKANRTDSGLQCQHGPAECFGNLVHDCVLSYMSSLTDDEKVNYVACELETQAAVRRDYVQCAQPIGVSTMQIETCVSSDIGTALQQASELATGLVQPKFIPTITIDGVFNQDTQDSAMDDLVGALCQFLNETSACLHYFKAEG